MVLSSEGGDNERNNFASFPSLTKEIISTKKKRVTKTLTSPSLHALPLPLPFLPFELIEEILSRLPVKLLLQLRCACKSWSSLISNPKFAKKHLSMSTRHVLHCISSSGGDILKSYPLDSIYTNATTTAIPQLEYSFHRCSNYFIGSCNGILCLAAEGYHTNLVTFRLWNPFIRKFKELPPLGDQQTSAYIIKMYGFGYDPVSDNYKVVTVLRVFDYSSHILVKNDEVKVYTLGINSWKSISVFPYSVFPVQRLSGKCVSGTINWLASKDSKQSKYFILSLDLMNESYQEVSLPNYGKVDACNFHLSVLRDCLIMFSGDVVWVMKEYGNKESWTKLFTISYNRDPHTIPYSCMKAIYVFEDDQVLLNIGGCRGKYIFYNCRNNTSKYAEFEPNPEVCVESLISLFS
ncbi:putative F-box domain-containing protein [Medicago truncatula]|uniref:F-box protein interaction domain protein n=1 Tax=Medicago truncatula TaxID=3880 RepID=G7IV91_MEDTR|nr:F-box/kelch-repeat protein At3g23880 [Medicago truncatula]AES68364.1 F-box protein interaction domain protein [Medicago truncatula]RHN65305.1 putative F-box domain-containing protein [Medicago truncatula]